ncbi:iron-containing alcohol dehydrogenase [Acetobacterium paludosum]|uniref:Iron-containing alcohol dehydrogenase n=1 Tax=Acetobacterium paludosum TaxID=52693 RepID=A0A923KRP4_9FIRM|nr:iron-containing alcohol dehydrogenase [Acetobacterium paludosum]MBC3887467.1 iron-containing alcohol dehydrogenase [Acetobacterium paludosum]
MQNFDFYNPTHIIFGKDRLASINENIPVNATVLITYGGGSAKRSGLIDKIKMALGNRKIYEFGGIEPNPKYETIVKAVEVVKNEQVDFLLAVGGGSVIDGTKFIAAASKFDGDSREILKGGYTPLPVEEVVPFGTVLTLPATGSEMNPTAVISYEHAKYFFSSPLLFPKFSVVDPTITFTLPQKQVANGVIDAFIHVTEQYLTFPVDGRVQDRMAEGILQTLIEIGGTSVSEPENYDARANHVWSATMALNGLIGCGVPQDWSTHFIGHELTAMFGIDHGQTLAIILPSLLVVRREQKRAKLLQYAERVWHIDTGSEEEKIDQAIQKTRGFFESLGVKTHLSEYGIGADKIPAIVEQLKAHGMTAISETGDLTLEISQKILESSM